MNKINERAWAGQIIAWIQEAISLGKTIFQHASNDEGIKVASGRTKFPDILLFTNKTSGIIFNGWELKFPDTAVDNIQMLENALEKAERLKANSFVTWNGCEAIIWLIIDNCYTLSSIKRLKTFPKEKGIENRNDLADPNRYRIHEPQLKARLLDILHSLQQLLQNGILKEAINISTEWIEAIRQTSKGIIPQLKEQIDELKGDNFEFRKAFNLWKIQESGTLKLLATSSRRVEMVEPEMVLAKFTYYKWIGKIIFYLTLAENLSGKVPKLTLTASKSVKEQLDYYFNQAKKIDYQAIFEPDFTDELEFTEVIETLTVQLMDVFNHFDFKVLPSEVIGNLLENLVPNDEKQKFGQYFTPELLALLVAFSAIKSRNAVIMDPTSGTGTFLNAFYQILSFFGKKNHQELLDQIWGNDISHFPAVLSVINLYKQRVEDVANFPRVLRKDYFKLQPQQVIQIPDNKDISKMNALEIPTFDAIIANFPFIQQEDIPNDILNNYFKTEFSKSQEAFLKNGDFKINEKSDYYTYCLYHSLKFLKVKGHLAIITSNAWLGKNYGQQFKKFLLDNFSIQYVVKSNAEHWFKNSQVSTIFMTLQKGRTEKPTKFITINFKLAEKFTGNSKDTLQKIEDLYSEIDYCDSSENWVQDEQFKTVHKKNDLRVSIVNNKKLIESLETQENWETYFLAENPLNIFDGKLINPQGNIFTNGRGTRTGKDEMHILTHKMVKDLQLEPTFLQPVLQTSRHINTILHDKVPDTYLFICDQPEALLQKDYPNTYKWIKKWEIASNQTGGLLPTVFSHRKPFWYTLKPERPANIFISINPDKKLFFSYSPQPIHLNQRLVAIRANPTDVVLVAALLNSVVSLLILELNGISRNLGALDLNADFFKTKMRIFNPALLNEKEKNSILDKFNILCNRPMEQYDKEFKLSDRKNFDVAILKAFGYNITLLPTFYELLVTTIRNRVEMKNR
jgi:N-6 DNA Methylase